MNSTISLFYFSGTGNSFSIAKNIQSKLANCELISIASLLEYKEIQIESESIGFVFPSYCQDVPDVIKHFIPKLKFNCSNPYIFCIVNCGGEAGNTLSNFKKLLPKKNRSSFWGDVIAMADNSVYYSTPPQVKEKRFEEANRKAEVIATVVQNRKMLDLGNPTSQISKHIQSKLLKFAMLYYIKIGQQSNDKEKCSKCKKCIEVCPSHNISGQGNELTWGKNCIWCFSCIHLCPQGAIQFGKLKVSKKTQFINPNISATELIKNNKITIFPTINKTIAK